jgi:hypothetical protein
MDGLIDHYEGWFVWSTDEIVKRNMEMRTFPGFEGSFMPFDPLLFFGMTEAATYTFSRYAAARSNTSSCFDGTTKPTAEYWKSTISKRTWRSSSLHFSSREARLDVIKPGCVRLVRILPGHQLLQEIRRFLHFRV